MSFDKTIQFLNLSKVYQTNIKALNNVSFSISEGEIFGFLGPNGAGKTTAVKVLNGILSPSEGECTVFGLNPAKEPDKVHQISGVLTEHAQMYDNLTGLENLLFFGKIFGVSESELISRAKKHLEYLNLSHAKNQKLSTYSTGMRQRLSLARALIHDPKVLFLDEPTSGLDPESAQNVNNLIKSLAKEQGKTIFLCTHQLRYAQEICSSYGLIDKGELFALGNLDSLRKSVTNAVTLSIKSSSVPQKFSCKLENGFYKMSVKSEEEIPTIVKEIVEDGGKIYHVSAEKPTLEEIYFSLMRSETNGGKTE